MARKLIEDACRKQPNSDCRGHAGTEINEVNALVVDVFAQNPQVVAVIKMIWHSSGCPCGLRKSKSKEAIIAKSLWNARRPFARRRQPPPPIHVGSPSARGHRINTPPCRGRQLGISFPNPFHSVPAGLQKAFQAGRRPLDVKKGILCVILLTLQSLKKSNVDMHISQWPKLTHTRWYLGVRCKKCRSLILFALDRTQGEGRFVPAGKLVLTCSQPECRHQADYSRAKVSRFQKS
jgi:hypothetical protein